MPVVVAYLSWYSTRYVWYAVHSEPSVTRRWCCTSTGSPFMNSGTSTCSGASPVMCLCESCVSITACTFDANSVRTVTISETFADAGRVSASECQILLAEERSRHMCEQSLTTLRLRTPVSAHTLFVETPLTIARGRMPTRLAVARMSVGPSVELVMPMTMESETVFSVVVRARLFSVCKVSQMFSMMGADICAFESHTLSRYEPAFPST